MDAGLPDNVLDGVRRRDPATLAACYEAFADPLHRYLQHRCGDPVQAEDLVEATFLELVEEAPALVGGPSAVRAWLFRAARNNHLDWVRKTRRRGDVPLDEQSAATRPAPEQGPAERAVAADHATAIRDALMALSPDQQEVLVLRFYADLSGPEIAEITGRRVGAIRALQHRGLRTLERVLRERGQLEALRPATGAGRIDPPDSRADQARSGTAPDGSIHDLLDHDGEHVDGT